MLLSASFCQGSAKRYSCKRTEKSEASAPGYGAPISGQTRSPEGGYTLKIVVSSVGEAQKNNGENQNGYHCALSGQSTAGPAESQTVYISLLLICLVRSRVSKRFSNKCSFCSSRLA